MSTREMGLKQASLSHWIVQEPYEAKFARAKERELKRCYRRNPTYVESLVMAEYFHEQMKAQHFLLSAESLIDMCRFSQRTKWLCPWGEQLYNEIHREPMQTYPERMCDDYHHIRDSGNGMLAVEDLKALVDDESNEWERVFICDPQSLDWIENLFKHPIEEFHFAFNGIGSKYQDDFPFKYLQYITRCKTIRVINLECMSFPDHFHSEFLRLKNLECLNGMNLSGFPDILEKFTNLRFCEIINRREGPDDYWYYENLEMVKAKQNTLQHIELTEPPNADYVDVLTNCPNLQTFILRDAGEVTDADIIPILSHSFIQRNLHTLRLRHSSASPEIFALLAKFTNLRFLSLDDCNITDKEAARIILNNKFHMREVCLNRCKHIGTETLNAIAQCAHLEFVDLRGGEVKKAPIKQYIRERRPNYGAIRLSYSLGY